MKRIKKITMVAKGEGMKKVVLLIGITFLLTVKASAYDDGDFQIWNTDIEEFKINNNSKLAFEEEFRWADNANQFFYHHYDAGVFYTINKCWNLGGGYRHVYEMSKGKFKVENEPYLVASLFLEKRGFVLESRNRLEYRHFDYKADAGRYRNKFTLKLPWKFTKSGIQPFFGDEIFVGFGGTNQFNQNRFFSGLSANLTKNIKAEIYYMLVSAKSSGKWIDSNVLGTKLKLSF